jgi:predicted GNAT family acetyltransferase
MTVRHNEAAHRYELDTPHGTAITVYRTQGESRIFTHTEVPPPDEGRGIGAALVRAALDDSKANGFRIVPACSFVAAFMRRHPEYGSG